MTDDSGRYWLTVEIEPGICKVVEKSMSDLSDNIEKLGPAHAMVSLWSDLFDIVR